MSTLAEQVKQMRSQVAILSRDIICQSNQPEVQALVDDINYIKDKLSDAWMAVRAQERITKELESLGSIG